MGSLTIGVCQMRVTYDKAVNLQKAETMVRRAYDQGAQLVVLPECFNAPYDLECLSLYAEAYPNGESIQRLQEMAERYRLWIVGGSIPEREAGCLYNTSFIFNPQGELAARYRKVHLFDIDIPGSLQFRESDSFTPGWEPVVVTNAPIPFGVAICYDVRFPEWMRKLADLGAQLLILPAVFSETTGPSHWELLLRSRAVDHQVYMVGAGQAPNPEQGLKAHGHSMVIDPWGTVAAVCGREEALLVVDISRDRVKQTREQLPLLKNMRRALYG